MDVRPLSIIFVKSDSKGDRLLFRYPSADKGAGSEAKRRRSGRHNPYALTTNEDMLQNSTPRNHYTSGVNSDGEGDGLASFSDEVLSTLFAVKAELCNRKFELKVNDVRFVGHPTLLPYRSNKDDCASMILINIVFALKASASHSIVKCYYDLSKRLGKALWYEEKRTSYLSDEMKIMMAAVDEATVVDCEIEAERDRTSDREDGRRSPFHVIRQRSSLARSMVQVFEDLSTTGIVQVRINHWVLVSFCLPQKAHECYNGGRPIEPETIDKCLSRLKPYHGILLLVDPNELLDSIPVDGSPSLLRLIKVYTPLKTLQALAMETDLQMPQVYQLTGHLVYWAKATIIYPLCSSNVYVVAPGADTSSSSALIEAFQKDFPNHCLLQSLSMFSLPAPLWYHARCGAAGGGADGARLAKMAAWLLRRRLLMQLHTYVQFDMSHWGCPKGGKEYFCEKHCRNKMKRSDSTDSLNQRHNNVPEPVVQYGETYEEYPTTNLLNQTDFSHCQPIAIGSDRVRDYMETVGQSLDRAEREEMRGGGYKNMVDSGLSMGNVEDMHCHADVQYNVDEEYGAEVATGSMERRMGDRSGRYVDDVGGMNLNANNDNEMSLQPPTVICSAVVGCATAPPAPAAPSPPPPERALLATFTAEECVSIFDIPAAHEPEDLALLAQLHQKGYFRGEHHLEEIMYYENLTRSQVLTLIDKFRDLLITFETEDPAISMLYLYT